MANAVWGATVATGTQFAALFFTTTPGKNFGEIFDYNVGFDGASAWSDGYDKGFSSAVTCMYFV